MYTENECIDCIGFFATFPLIHPDQVYPNSTNIRSIGTVVKDQVIKWDHLRWRVLRPIYQSHLSWNSQLYCLYI